MVIEFDFSWLELQGRAVKGSPLTPHKVDRVVNAPKASEGDDAKKPTPAKAKSAPAKPKKKAESAKGKASAKPQGKDQATFDFKEK